MRLGSEAMTSSLQKLIGRALSSMSAIYSSPRRPAEQACRNSIAHIFGKQMEVRSSFEPCDRLKGLAAALPPFPVVTPVGCDSIHIIANDIPHRVTAEERRAKLPCAEKHTEAYEDARSGKIISHCGLSLLRRALTCAELANGVSLLRLDASLYLRRNWPFEPNGPSQWPRWSPFTGGASISADLLMFEARALSDLRADLVSPSGQGHHRS